MELQRLFSIRKCERQRPLCGPSVGMGGTVSPIQFLAHLELTTNEKLAFFHRPSSQQNASSRTFSSASCFSVESHSLTGSATCLPSCQIPSRVGRGTPSISSKLRKRCLHFAFSNGLTPPKTKTPLNPVCCVCIFRFNGVLDCCTDNPFSLGRPQFSSKHTGTTADTENAMSSLHQSCERRN